ncbi:MAG: DUF4013 domain-containing protein, partial [Deltaproteobacteria bacterium]|nr:DUF4013 domain-containing protein [Deltaproteobacteria bacterium]
SPSAPPGLDFLGAFKFLFSDKNTLNNILLGAVMNIIPIVGPIVLMGWYCEIIQRLVKRHPNPIPKLTFDDFVYFLGRGVAPFVVVLIATLPMVLVTMVFMFAGMFGITMFAGAIQHQGGDPGMLVIAGFGIAFLFAFAFIMVFNVVVMAALIRAELTEDIGKSLDLGKIWAYARATWKDLLVAYLVFIPLSILVMFGGMMVFFIGIYFAIVVINISYLHLRWQVYERYLSRGGEAIPIQTKSGPLPSEQRPTLPTPTPTPG